MSEVKIPMPDDLAGLRIRVMNLGKKASKLAVQAQEISNELEEIWIRLVDEVTPGEGVLKREDGRLNEAGVRAINSAFESGCSVTDAAKTFGISPSAASTRRKVWMASSKSVEKAQPMSKTTRSKK